MKYTPNLTAKEIKENHASFMERQNRYKDMGLDFNGSRDFILKNAFPLGDRILEIGTGNGHTTLALAKKGLRVTSIDNDKEAIKIAALNLAYENLISNVEFYLMDGKALLFIDERFNSIVAVNLFHHIEGIDALLSEMDRVLCPGGKIVTADFNEKGMELINSVHKSEGRKHENSDVKKEYIVNYFKNSDYDIDEFDDDFHWAVTAQKRRKND